MTEYFDELNGAQDCVFEETDDAVITRPIGNPRPLPELEAEIKKLKKALEELRADEKILVGMLADAEIEMCTRLDNEVWKELMGGKEGQTTT